MKHWKVLNRTMRTNPAIVLTQAEKGTVTWMSILWVAQWIYPLVNVLKKNMENHHRFIGKNNDKWPFSIAFCMFTRGYHDLPMLVVDSVDSDMNLQHSKMGIRTGADGRCSLSTESRSLGAPPPKGLVVLKISWFFIASCWTPDSCLAA